MIVTDLPNKILASPSRNEETALEDSSDHLDEISPLRNMRAVGHIGGPTALSILMDGSVQASYRGRDY